ncbi:inositol 1, 3, 4-trisphosphate 5/6-kinase-domain-containing protein [Blastocladiella britannica]|nr:inositol 1, 3, 4-trisphosphate 5/6-kinase-domain-containing protein [Blastocladiella britannica]
MESRPLCIGLILPAKKLGSIGVFHGIQARAVARNIQLVYIDLGHPIADQGAFDVIVHKTSELHLAAIAGTDPAAAAEWPNLVSYATTHPTVRWVDPLASVEPLQSRTGLHEYLKRAAAAATSDLFAIPETQVLTVGNQQVASNANCRKYPVIVKRDEACSTAASHMMAVATGPRQWAHLMSGTGLFAPGEQVLAQTLVAHGGVLFKVYVLGSPAVGIAESAHALARPSISVHQLPAGDDLDTMLVFDSQGIPKTFDDSATKSDRLVDRVFLGSSEAARERARRQLTEGGGKDGLRYRLQQIADALAISLNLTLFGFDAVMGEDDGQLYVVDVNFFPSFSGLDIDFQDVFLSIVEFVGRSGQN